MLSVLLVSRRQGISKHTLLFYQRCFNKAIGIELTSEGISTLLSSLSCGNGKHAYFRAIRALCNLLTREGHLRENPIKRVDIPKVAKKLLASVTLEQGVSLVISITEAYQHYSVKA